jgi:prophage regulatory protein
MTEKILRLPAVREKVGLGTTAIYGRIKRGEFPGQIKMGRLSGWVESEVDAWIQSHVAQRGASASNGEAA